MFWPPLLFMLPPASLLHEGLIEAGPRRVTVTGRRPMMAASPVERATENVTAGETR
ncbi:MAG: hypothetical protein JO110_20250 [Acetobacteraceae bacterium]|nr:hypothetical protein [Acetobacteraceae bacterium]